jgi:hypothetical protein
MTDNKFDDDMDELSAMAEAHIEAMRTDQEVFDAALDELCDLADRIDLVARFATRAELERLLTVPVPSRPTAVDGG